MWRSFVSIKSTAKQVVYFHDRFGRGFSVPVCDPRLIAKDLGTTVGKGNTEEEQGLPRLPVHLNRPLIDVTRENFGPANQLSGSRVFSSESLAWHS